MSFTREVVHLRIQELWTSSDSLRRAEANKYLLEFKDSFHAWQICSELLDLNVEPEVKYVAAQTLCQKVANSQSEVNSIGGPKVIFDRIYLRTISESLRTGGRGNLMSQLLSKLGEGLSYLIILGISDGSWMEGFESCLRISQPYFVGQGTGLELWIILNTIRYIPDAGALLESQKRPILIQSVLPRTLDFLSESVARLLSDSAGGGGGGCQGELSQKLLELSLDILVEYFEKFEVPLFTHGPLSLAISNLLKSDVNIAPYRLAELFVRGLPRCSFYMQKQGAVGDPGSIVTLIEDATSLHVSLKFPSEAETAVMMSLLNYLKLLYDKLRQIPLPGGSNNITAGNYSHTSGASLNNDNNNTSSGNHTSTSNSISNSNNTSHGDIGGNSTKVGGAIPPPPHASGGQESHGSGDQSQMIRINTWSTLKMNVPQIYLDEDTERSILSWSGVIFSLLEGYSTVFIIGELPEVKARCSSQGKVLDNPLSFLPEMLSLLLTLHVRIPGVLVNMWCTLRDLVNEGVITKDQGLSIAGMLITPAVQSLATQCRTDFFYWEKLGINENSIMNARINTYSNFGLKELTLDDSVEEFLDFLDTATLHISDIYFFLSSLGALHSQGFITFIQHSLISCSNENDPVGCVVFLRFSDTLIEAANSLQGTVSSILELACSTLPKTRSCIYQITLLLQKSAHLLVDREHAPIWLLSLRYLIQISQQSNLLLVSSTFEELCQLGADHIVGNPNCDQILLELSQSVIQVVTSKLQFSSEACLYANISIIDENIGFVGGFVHMLCYTMIKNNQSSIPALAEALKSFLCRMVHSTIEQIPQVYNNASFSSYIIDIGMVPQCCWIWSVYVFLKILKSFTFCLESSSSGGGLSKSSSGHASLGGLGFDYGGSDASPKAGSDHLGSSLSSACSGLAHSLAVFIGHLFSAQDQQMFILGEKLRSLLFNSFNLYSESQGYGVVLISSMMYQYSRNISLHNLMICTRRSFTGSESCLSCPKDIIASICYIVLKMVSSTWSVSANLPGGGEGGGIANSIQRNSWCTWEFTYSNIKQRLLHLKSELDSVGNNERMGSMRVGSGVGSGPGTGSQTLIVRQRHGCCTMLLHEIVKRLPAESRDSFVSMMYTDGISSLLYEFWISKFYSITNVEISRSMEPFFMWQISLLSNCRSPTLSIRMLLSSQYLAPTLEITVQSLQLFNDKYLLSSVLIYLTKLSTAMHSFSQTHHAWKEQLGRILVVLFSVYHGFEKNSLLQMCKFVSVVLEYFPDVFFTVLNEMFSPEFGRVVHPEIRVNPFQDTNQRQQSIIVICFKSLKGGGPRLRQFLCEISNVTNGVSSMDNCLGKFEVLFSSGGGNNGNAGGVVVNAGNPIIIS